LIRVSACTGIGETAGGVSGGSVYPNPSNGEFTISAKSAIELQLINELGQVVKEISLNNGNLYKIEVKNISNGIYFLKSDGEIHIKLVVEK